MRKKKTTEEFIAQLHTVQPNLFVLGEYKGAGKKIKVQDKFGVCDCYPSNLLQGFKPSILTAIDKDSYFIAQLSVVQPDLEIMGKYVDGATKIKVQDKFGVCMCRPDHLLQGKKPTIQTAINKDSYFIARSREIHCEKYDYSKVKYVNFEIKVIITCTKHGEFEQCPDSHLRGDGCPACGSTGAYSPILAERNKKEWKNIPAIVYFIKCWNDDGEEFFKIGITTRTVRARFKGLDYRWESLREINTNLYDATYLEQRLHEQHKNFKYTPKISFAGHTECFSKLF